MKNEKTIVAISGDTSFTDNTLFTTQLTQILKKYGSKIIIRTGTRDGTETLAANYARENGYELDVIEHSEISPVRYHRLLKNADVLINVWGGIDKESKNLVDFATFRKIKVATISYSPDTGILSK